MRYYVNSYPNPRAEDGETSGYWQRRSQVFGKPIINPNPEKVDLDGDGIVEAKQSSLLAHEGTHTLQQKGKIKKPELQKPGRKISFSKDDINKDGKIALDLVANDINQLVKDLYDIGVDGIITFENNASVKINANKIPALEQLPSLAFGRTNPKEVTRKNGKIAGIAMPEQPEEGRIEVRGTDKRFFDVNFPNTPNNTIGTIGEGKKKKTFEEIEKEGREFVERATKSLVINPGNTWRGAYMLPGGDSARSLVPGQPPSNFAGNTVNASKKVTERVSETAKALTEKTTNKKKKVSGTGVTLNQNTLEERTGTKQNNGYQITTKKETKISYDGINFMPWKEGSPQPMPQQSKSSTRIAIKSAGFEGQAKLPQNSKRNAFGQPIGLNSSASRTIGGSSSGGSSNTQQVRMGGSSSGGSSGGGTKIQVSPGGSSTRVQVSPGSSNSKGSRKSSSSHRSKK